MNSTSVIQRDRDDFLVMVEPGAELISIYAELYKFGLVLPGGSCPTVAAAGFTLGGGFGLLSRQLGLMIDSLLAAEIVLASGEVILCNQTHHQDLFWALRGAGGGNFGIGFQRAIMGVGVRLPITPLLPRGGLPD